MITSDLLSTVYCGIFIDCCVQIFIGFKIIIRERTSIYIEENERTLPMASNPLSKSITTPRKRNARPKPANPTPISV